MGGGGWELFLDLRVWVWLGGGFLVTLKIAAVVVGLSLITGTIAAVIRMSKVPILRHLVVVYIEGVRSAPVFLIIVYTFFGFSKLGLNLSVATSVTAALTMYATAVISEIVRAGLRAVPKGQSEAARTLGFNRFQTFRYIELPQAVRMMVPPLVGQYIILIKHTSIGAIVGLDELLHRTVILYNGYQNPVQSLIVVALIYICFLYLLSTLSRKLELHDQVDSRE